MADIIPIECLSGEVLGCTYSGATNYDPLATFDDGSCIFPPIITGNTFEVNIFGTHYSDCNNNVGGYFLHIPKIIAETPVNTFHMYIKLFAYNYPYALGASEVRNGCTTGEFYQNQAINLNVTGDYLRVANEKKQIIHIDNLTPAYTGVFSVIDGDTDHDFAPAAGLEFTPVEIIIYSDGVKYTGSGNVSTLAWNVPIDDTISITVN
jgi:hypothetical protein